MHRQSLLLGVLTLFSVVAAARANVARLTPEQAEEARALVRRLGDRSFKERETATKKLMELGRAGIPILEQGAKDSDTEVRRRSERLLELAQRSDTEVALALYMSRKDDSRLLKLPSYERFGKLVGKDDASKKLFVDMYCAEGSMLAELDSDPKGFSTKFTAHCQKIQQNLYTPWGQANPLPHHQVVALIFMATDPHVSKDVQTFYMMNNLFYQPSVKQGFQENAGSRRLLVTFLEQRSNAQTAQQVFYIAKQLGLKEAVPMAVKVLEDKAANQYARGMAVLFIGQMGGKEHQKTLEKLLEDRTAIGAVNIGGGGKINAQVRDVALAALIMTSGQSLWDYDFPYMKNFRGYRGGDLNLPPYYYGFNDDAGRDAALKKWKESQAEAPKKK
jgi:hypothetical protein